MKKEQIREKLREGITTNSIGVNVSRPNQELIIMRGVPGSGKSTKAKTLVGEGVIHSTDDLIESLGDYNAYFREMIESGDWSKHSRMHSVNLRNAIRSMTEGVSPVVIDNTNIKANEAKGYVMAALEMGFDERNIKIVDVGVGGKTLEELAARNTHGVSLETITKMAASHKSVGELTVKMIVESKDLYKKSDILYSAVVLDDNSKNRLYSVMANKIPKDWKVICHHMTIVFGKKLPKDMKSDLGKSVSLVADEFGLSDMAAAVKVFGYPSKNAIPHITLAINADAGAKAVMSNDITNWVKLDTPINLTGVVSEIKK